MSDVEQWEHGEQRAMENEITILREQLAALAEQNAKMREALIAISHCVV